MIVYNTLHKKKEELVPVCAGKIGMYSCGPTVYNYAHIGNLRTYVFMDILRRALEHEGYKVKSVMNITDVGHLVSDADAGEDKMEKASREQQKSPYEIAEYYTKVFFDDIAALNIKKPTLTPKATDHIKEMIDFVEKLVEKGYGYETSDGIYFDIMKYGRYGQLSDLKLEDQKAGARVEVNSEKRHPADFALWKKAPKEHIMQWESPWGMGYPGWHIECSAMSLKYLGEDFDIHTGGVDHIPVHHENEIAQTEALLGHPSVHYWMHGEFMMVNGGKMSKSLGNTYTVSDLRAKGFDPLAFRYFCLNSHYRNKMNFTWEAMEGAAVSYTRLLESALAHSKGDDGEEPAAKEALNEFFEAISDDLNAPKALGILWKLARNPHKSRKIYEAMLEMDKILALDIDKCEQKLDKPQEIDPEAQQLAQQRNQARKNKDWALSDQLRDRLLQMGYNVLDTKEGTKLERK